MQMYASSLTLDFLSSFCAFAVRGMKAGLPQHLWMPVLAGGGWGSGRLAGLGHPPTFCDSRFLNAEAGCDFCLNKCPSCTFACRALPHLHLPPPPLQGGTSPSLNHNQNPITFAPYLLLFLKWKEEEK